MAEFKGKKGHWVTTESGSHIFIENDGTYEEAVEKAFGKENAGKYKKYEEEPQKATMFNTDKEYQDFIKPKIQERYQEYKNQGYSKEEIIDELKDEFGYQNLIDDVIKEGSISDEEFDDDYESDFEDNDWSKWATKIDRSVPNNWTPDGFDGDTRFYNVSNQKGVESVSTKPNGNTRVYTTEGSIAFDSLEEAQKFINASTKEEATKIAWDRGWLGEGEEQAIDDMFKQNDELFNEAYGQDDFDSDELIVDEIGPNKKEQKQIKKEAKQRKDRENSLDETTKKVESLISEGKGKEFLDVLNGLSEEDAFEVLKRIKGKK